MVTLLSHYDPRGILRDDDNRSYLGRIPADGYAFTVDHRISTPTMRSVVDAARAVIDPIVAEYTWVLTLKRTDDRDYFKFWIAPAEGHPNAPCFKFCDGINWNWTYLFPPKSSHYDEMVAARARD